MSAYGFEEDGDYEDETQKQKTEQENMKNYEKNYLEEDQLLQQPKESLIMQNINQRESLRDEKE